MLLLLLLLLELPPKLNTLLTASSTSRRGGCANIVVVVVVDIGNDVVDPAADAAADAASFFSGVSNLSFVVGFARVDAFGSEFFFEADIDAAEFADVGFADIGFADPEFADADMEPKTFAVSAIVVVEESCVVREDLTVAAAEDFFRSLALRSWRGDSAG